MRLKPRQSLNYFCRFFFLLYILSLHAYIVSYISKTSYQIDINFEKMPSAFVKPAFVDYWKGTNRSLTCVTAFFDIGNFSKVVINQTRYLDEYKKWREAFKYMKNPLVIYTDSIEFAKYFQINRNEFFSFTKVVVVSRQELWSFKLLPKIAAVYSKPDRPIYYPHTKVPAYTSITHSKLTLVVKAIQSNYFNSDYYCWVDMGYFRHIFERQTDFFLEIPPDIDNSKIAVTRVYDSNLNQTSAKDILINQMMWVGGGLFLGKPDVITRFEFQFKHRVEYYLSKGLMNNEEQIIYAMYTKEERKSNPISIELQLYIPGTKNVVIKEDWFYLGYVMYHELPKQKVFHLS